MVKPPRTMQPESIAGMDKAGRSNTKSFGHDSFHVYMARKIALQRQQFGLKLPPPPPTQTAKSPSPVKQSPEIQSILPPQKNLKTPSSLLRKRKHDSSKAKEGELHSSIINNNNNKHHNDSNTPSATSPMRVRFAPDSKPAVSTENSIQRKLRERERRERSQKTNLLLKRLKRRHGRRSSSLSQESEDKSQEESQLIQEEKGMVVKSLIFSSWSQRKRQNAETETKDDIQDEPRRFLQTMDTIHLQADNSENGKINKDALCSSSGINLENLKNNGCDHVTGDTILRYMENNQNVQTAEQQKSTMAETITRNRPDLFLAGVVVIVNGDTNPDADTLQRMLHRHGGDLEKYETSRITHIIAEHLSFAKAKMYRTQRNPKPVVYPSWIVDSVAAQRQLPTREYLIEEFRNQYDKSQPSMQFFLVPKSESAVEVTRERKLCTNDLHGRDMATKAQADQTEEEVVAKEALQSFICPDGGKDGDGLDRLSNPHIEDEKIPFPHNKLSESLASVVTVTDKPTKVCHRNPEVQPTVTVGENSDNPESSTGYLDSKQLDEKESVDSSSPEKYRLNDKKYIDGRVRTVGTDPDFLESFFRNSRLSYIGSFKQRQKSRLRTSPSANTGKGSEKARYVFHVDMDCFFAAVVLRNYPEYENSPVAISHHGRGGVGQANGKHKASTSECATCNYEARKYGIKKGMYLGRAKELCPQLVVLEYDFDGYQEVSAAVSDILNDLANQHNGIVEEVSCDESYMEIHFDDRHDNDAHSLAVELAEFIRSKIFETTRCTATVGVAQNKFLAKVATDRCKPNGLFVARGYRELLQPLKLRDLHGIGYRSEPKLAAVGLATVQDVWDRHDSCSLLKEVLGGQLGTKIWQFCQGQDDRQVEAAERKTIGAECNYGVRFNGQYGPDHMIMCLAKEVEKRMKAVRVMGTKITLKMKQRKPNAPPPPKYLGHGSCFNISRSQDTRGGATRDQKEIAKICLLLFEQMNIAKEDIRGMGIVVSCLSDDSVSTNGGIRKYFVGEERADDSKTASNLLLTEGNSPKGKSAAVEILHSDDDAFSDIELPTLSQIHMSQVGYLPSPMQREIKRKIDENYSSRRHETQPEQSKSTKRRSSVHSMFNLPSFKSEISIFPHKNIDHMSFSQLQRLTPDEQLEMAKRVSLLDEDASMDRMKGPDRRVDNGEKSDQKREKRCIGMQHADSMDFYWEKFIPLTEFLDNNAPTPTFIETVRGCFDELIDAGLFSDVNALLRTILRRKDEWNDIGWNAVRSHVHARIARGRKS